jgi:hypothetical protein
MQVSTVETTQAMSSVELVDIINEHRPEDSKELRHDNFMVKIEKHPGIDWPKFLGKYKDRTGRTLKCYYLPKREAALMVMSESLEVQTRVYDRMITLSEAGLLNTKTTHEALDLAPKMMAAALAFGLDKNAAAISSNNAIRKITGTDVLALLDSTHLLAEKQERIYTPTELGAQFLGGLSARKVNQLLAEAGLQSKEGDHWEPQPKADGQYRLLDTGKKHSNGTLVQQTKWFASVVDMLEPYPEN